MTWIKYNILDIISIVITIIGFLIAIYQIIKTKKIAVISQEVSEETRQIVHKNSILIDISKNIELIKSIKHYLLSNKFDLVLFQLHDLHSNLIQIKNIHKLQEISNYSKLKEVLPQLSILKNTIEDFLIDSRKSINIRKHIGIYNDLSEILNQILGEIKYGVN